MQLNIQLADDPYIELEKISQYDIHEDLPAPLGHGIQYCRLK